MFKNRKKEVLAKDIAKPIDTVIHEDVTVEEAINSLRGRKIHHKIIYFYVVDKDNKLLGVTSTRRLLLSESNAKVSEIMDAGIICLSGDQTPYGAMELFTNYNLLAIPVTDDEGKLLGAIDVEMVLEESCDIADARHRLDIFQLIGLTLEDEKKASVLRGYRLRMPWILCNMVGGFACAIISSVYHVVLSKIILLAIFIPLVLTLSEGISMQSMTHILQFLRHPRVSIKFVLIKVFREWKIVGLMAISSGIFVGLISLIWGQGIMPSITIGSGITISVAISSTFGIVLPITLHTLRLDPKVASGPVVLMVADILTTAIYLSIASALLL